VGEVLDRVGKLYLAAGVGLGLIVQPFSPGDPERQLARHIAVVEGLLERTPIGDRERAVPGISWKTPSAPAEETAVLEPPFSRSPMPIATSSGTPFSAAFSLIVSSCFWITAKEAG